MNNGVLRNRGYHQKRYIHSYQNYYGRCPKMPLTAGIDIPPTYRKGVFKVKISYNDNDRQIDFSPYQIKAINTLKLIEDDTIDYALKYSNRKQLAHLYQYRGSCDDVLIVKNGLITDSSFCNIIFLCQDCWLTPKNPLLAGTMRQKLLDSKRLQVEDIRPADLAQFSHFKLINAMRDFDNVRAVEVSQIVKLP